MGKNTSNLQLINGEGSSKAGSLAVSLTNGSLASGDLQFLDIITLSQLGQAERKKIERIVQNIAPNAEIVGAARPSRAYDLRAIVCEGEGRPLSIIRFFGPEAALVADLNRQVEGSLLRIRESNPQPTVFFDSGTLDGQLYYRRLLVPSTLSEKLQSSPSISLIEAFTIGHSLLTAVGSWHRGGLLHGHITSSNIFLGPDGAASLLDPLIGLAVVQAGAALEMGDLSKDYDLGLFAPESLSSVWPGLEADIFGCGKVFWELFSRVPRGEGPGVLSPEGLRGIRSLILQMTAEDPRERLSGIEAVEQLDGLNRSFGGVLSTPTKDATENKQGETPGTSASRATQEGKGASSQTSANIRAPKPAEDSRGAQDTAPRPGGIPSGRFAVKGRIVRPTEVKAPAESSAQSAAPSKSQGAEVELAAFGKQERQVSAPKPQPRKHHEVKEVFFSSDDEESPVTESVIAPKISEPPVAAFVPPLAQSFKEKSEPQKPEIEKTAERDSTDDISSKFDDLFALPKEDPEPATELFSAPVEENAAEFEQEEFSEQPSREIPYKMIGIGAVALLVLFLLFGRGGSSGNDAWTKQELVEAWGSARKSEMVEVALLALREGEVAEAAQNTIIASALTGDRASEILGSGTPLLQAAFDNRWEMSLAASDRQQVMQFALASSGLIGEDALQNKVPLSSLHPAVLIALASTANEAGAEALRSVSAERFTELPAPVGSAFKELISGSEQKSAADADVRMLARFAVRGVSSIDELLRFLRDGSTTTLNSLVTLSSNDPKGSELLLEKLLQHPNAVFEGEGFRWAREAKLMEWSGLDAADKLGLLVGRVVSREIALPYLTSLLAHPAPAIRGYAIGQTIERIKLEHPGALSILSIVKDNPKILNGVQTYGLAAIVQKPEKVSSDLIRNWIASGIPTKFLELMLVSSATSKSGNRLDFELTRALRQTKDWTPSGDVLELLIQHPEKLTRVLAYEKTSALQDRDYARRILDLALAREQAPELQELLEQWLQALK